MERAFEISKLSGVFQSQSDFAILDSQVVHTVGQDGERGSHWEKQEEALNDYWGESFLLVPETALRGTITWSKGDE